MKKLWNRLFPQRTDESGNLLIVDESDSLVMSLGISILFFSILVTFGWFNIPDPLFLATAVFALYFSLAMSYKNSIIKTIFLTLTFPITTYSVFIIQELTTDLNRINNGLSLLALSLSLLFMPIKKLEEKTSKKISASNEKLIEKQDVYISTLELNNQRLDEINNSLIDDLKRFSSEIDRLRHELSKFTLKANSEIPKEPSQEIEDQNNELSSSNDNKNMNTEDDNL